MTSCPALSTVTSDTRIITKDNQQELLTSTDARTPGTSVTLSCRNGFTLVGPQSTTCRSDGNWDYTTKPFCSDGSENTPSGDSLDEQTKIMIGVVAGVAGLIVIALICMICYIWYRERKRQRAERMMMYGFQDDRKSRRYYDGHSDMEMRSRGKPGPYIIDDYGSRDYDRASRFPPMYLPDRRRDDYYDHFDRKSRRPRSVDYDDDRYSDPGRKPYVRDWVTRNSIYGAKSDEFLDRPGVHGYGRWGRDKQLWRNAV